MTKKEKKTSTKNNELEKLKKELETLKEENKKLENKLKDKEEILKNTQLQYITLKNDFDLFTRRLKEQEQQHKDELLIKIIKNFLPIVDDFKKSYEHIPEELKKNKWVEGLMLINKKIDNFLANQGIEEIKTVGENVDETLHEVLQMVEDKNNSGKIVKEITKGYILKQDNNTKIICPAKVIVGS